MSEPIGTGSADHFSSIAAEYRRYRPAYPDALFRYLATLTARRDLAWDCGAGSGQAALGLLPHFRRVIATDVSRSQIAEAPRLPALGRVAGRAEAAPVRTACVDLLTVAQALHWFANDAFYDEVRRVLRPGGVIAVWSYARLTVDSGIDDLVQAFYSDIQPWWPPERRFVDSGYRTIPFPFEEVPAPSFEMTARWTLDELVGYVGTWSALNRARAATGGDPLSAFAARLTGAWGDPSRRRDVRWPMQLRVAQIDG